MKSSEQFAGEYIQYLCKVLNGIDLEEISQFIRIILDARERGAAVYFIGNGGSAATASHFANDIAIGTRTAGKPFRAMSLCDNNSVMTAIANDDGYDEVFYQQLKVMACSGDVLVAISASGNSPNLLKAVEYANSIDMITVGLTAFSGGKLREMSQVGVHVPTKDKEYGPAEDAHMVLDHLVGNFLSRFSKSIG